MAAKIRKRHEVIVLNGSDKGRPADIEVRPADNTAWCAASTS